MFFILDCFNFYTFLFCSFFFFFIFYFFLFFFFSSRRRHTRFDCDWSSDVCSSDLAKITQSGTPILASMNFNVVEKSDRPLPIFPSRRKSRSLAGNDRGVRHITGGKAQDDRDFLAAGGALYRDGCGIAVRQDGCDGRQRGPRDSAMHEATEWMAGRYSANRMTFPKKERS